MINAQTDYQIVLDNLPFAACIKDLNGKIIGRNSKTLEYVLNENVYCDEVYIEDISVIKLKKPVAFERKLQTKSGDQKWHRIIKSPIFNKEKEIAGILVLFENIESIKEIENKKETFVAALTHDLKTPTIAQIRMIEILLNETLGKLNKGQKETLKELLTSAKYMFGMISRLLYVYKFENGDTKPEYKKFDFKELLLECSKELAPLLEDKHSEFKIKINTKNSFVLADKIQIRRALINLISNSIFHANPDTEIDISLEEDAKALIFTVTNSSPYIPPDILAALFDKYVSNPANLKTSPKGTGLGLYITERIISAHRGEIIAASSIENKNTFGFKIPKNPPVPD